MLINPTALQLHQGSLGFFGGMPSMPRIPERRAAQGIFGGVLSHGGIPKWRVYNGKSS